MILGWSIHMTLAGVAQNKIILDPTAVLQTYKVGLASVLLLASTV